MDELTEANACRRNVLKTLGAGAVLALGAIGDSTHAQPSQKMDVFIGTTPHFGNVIVGVEKKFFEKEGVAVALTNFASGSVAADAFR